VIKYVATTLGQDREKEIALPKLEKELAVCRRIGVHQLDGTSESLMPLPYALDFNVPGVLVCSHDLSGKYILRAVEASRGSDGVAGTCLRNASRADPTARQYRQKRCQILHRTSERRSIDAPSLPRGSRIVPEFEADIARPARPVDTRLSPAPSLRLGRYTRRLRPSGMVNVSKSLRTLAIGERVGKAGTDLSVRR
jgi:hypothetical protein